MIGSDSFLAAINDRQHLNSRSVTNLLIDIIRDIPSDNARIGELLSELRSIEQRNDGPQSKTARDVLQALGDADFTKYNSYINDLSENGIEFHHIFAPEYPNQLWNLNDPPLALYVDGTSGLRNSNIAVVGTRSATETRISDTEEMSAKLANEGYTIVSGLAKGVDAAAHRGAVDAEGKTLAILPSDIETVQPRSNSELADRIRRNGALVSEVSKFVKMHNGRYIERNRITSGISDAVIVMASGETGGTVRQAELAEQQNIPRFLYAPDDNSGQSPDVLREKGFATFTELSEIPELLEERHQIFNIDPGKETTLSEFCSS